MPQTGEKMVLETGEQMALETELEKVALMVFVSVALLDSW